MKTPRHSSNCPSRTRTPDFVSGWTRSGLVARPWRGAPFGAGYRGLGALLAGATLVVSALATGPSARNLADLSIEELMNETVTSVSKREQRLGDTASAIAVLSNDNLRRAGALSIPEALRFVPGVNVGLNNSREWSVSVRGSNNVYSNKLLVLVDGRTVYTPLFAGVYWDLQQTMPEDIARIEVIRGPGGTIWGANAVNGVINVITRSARDTQGGLVLGAAGDREALAGVRYGGRLGHNAYYRVFAGYQSGRSHPLANGRSARDYWDSRQAGFRVDHYPDEDTHVTWQADATLVDFDEGASDGSNVNFLGRWTRQLSERSEVELQAYYDRTYRNESLRSRPLNHTFDLNAQHTVGLGERHDLIWGFGYRVIASEIGQTAVTAPVRQGDIDLQLFSALVQDEFKLVPEKLVLTAGAKFEHNDFTGVEIQPSLRVVFKPAANRTLWAAVSRAVRTPDELEAKDIFAIIVGAPFPGTDGRLYFPTVIGNRALKSEVVWVYELGCRLQPAERVGVELAAFYSQFSDVISWGGQYVRLVPGDPFGAAELPWSNFFDGRSYGGEAAVTYSPAADWRLQAGYSYLVQIAHGPEGVYRNAVQDPPKHQVTLQSAYDFTSQGSLDVRLRHVAAIPEVPAYLSADVRLSYRPNESVEFSLVGQNLLDRSHPEQGPVILTVASEVPRSFYAKAVWHF